MDEPPGRWTSHDHHEINGRLQNANARMAMLLSSNSKHSRARWNSSLIIVARVRRDDHAVPWRHTKGAKATKGGLSTAPIASSLPPPLADGIVVPLQRASSFKIKRHRRYARQEVDQTGPSLFGLVSLSTSAAIPRLVQFVCDD